MLWNIDTGSKTSLQLQLIGSVRRALSDGELAVGDRLPPAAELAEALDVDRNTVLAAYRALREEGVLEFRRGRGVRVAPGAEARAPVEESVQRLIELARDNGYSSAELIRMIERNA